VRHVADPGRRDRASQAAEADQHDDTMSEQDGTSEGPALVVQPLGPDRTVEQHLVRELRTSILRGTLAPGVRLPYRTLAHQFGVSVTPVRVALRDLAKEGLVEISPHGGAYVAPLSVSALEELYATRTGLESWLSRLGAARLTDEQLAAMQAEFSSAERAVARHDGEAYLTAAWETRLVCYRAAERPRLLERVETVFNQSARYNSFTLMTPERLEDSFRSLRTYKAACEARDGRHAQQTIQVALERTYDYLVAHLGELGASASD
jgi:DNA-binding GntR family transcriptional regulator